MTDVKRAFVTDYIDQRLAENANPKTINQELRAFQATLYFLQERGHEVPRALFKIAGLKEPDSLPRFLTDEQVCALRDAFEQRVKMATSAVKQRNALLDRMVFYLMWQAGLRIGEVEELTLADLNLAQKQLVIRRGKGQHDRAVYLTETTLLAVRAYLAVRGESVHEHLLLFKHKPLSKDFIRERLKAAGQRVGVKVTPHQLRHTYATQLVNAGCKITTIQALLGHKHINTTLTYARVHDRTVAEDYFTAMAVIEKRLEPLVYSPKTEKGEAHSHPGPSSITVQHLLALVDRLQKEPLTEQQQALISDLQQGLCALENISHPIQPQPLVR